MEQKDKIIKSWGDKKITDSNMALHERNKVTPQTATIKSQKTKRKQNIVAEVLANEERY